MANLGQSIVVAAFLVCFKYRIVPEMFFSALADRASTTCSQLFRNFSYNFPAFCNCSSNVLQLFRGGVALMFFCAAQSQQVYTQVVSVGGPSKQVSQFACDRHLEETVQTMVAHSSRRALSASLHNQARFLELRSANPSPHPKKQKTSCARAGIALASEFRRIQPSSAASFGGPCDMFPGTHFAHAQAGWRGVVILLNPRLGGWRTLTLGAKHQPPWGRNYNFFITFRFRRNTCLCNFSMTLIISGHP